jgi:hypothetical protein
MLPRALKQHFVTAVHRMLRPVVRHLISQGVTHPALVEMLKELYVDVAERDFALPFKRQTDSRLALVTGLNRKEVSRLRRRAKAHPPSVEVEDNLVSRVIGRWMAGPPYATAGGRPHGLPYESERTREASFARLVRDLGVDIPVRSILDELLQAGTVELLPNGDVQLRQQVSIPAPDDPAKFTYLATDPAELFCTIMHNIEHPDAPRLQRKVVYDNVGSEALPEIHAGVRGAGEELIRRANVLLAAHDHDRNPQAVGGRRMRVVLGVYYFEEEEAAPTPPPPGDERPRLPGRIRRAK